ncbi:P2Y purinoceptor 1-like [Lampris incognitus]|uniref:P2Y purinoceptor 1-like n=1 Tax=Lampris incognitus TaxID=2546036 RepID=UPI0024B4DB62|nr:P2Y purinoceptor 1-like [Lampris incognitus]
MTSEEGLGRANVSACENINITFTHKFLPTVYVIVFVVGTFFNLWGLRSMYTDWNKVGNINIFMLNLGVADLLYLCTLPFLVAYYAQNSKWTFGQTFCKVTRFCFNLNLYGSIGFLTCISVYRYLGIVHPMKVMGKIRSRHSTAISLLVWVLVFIQILPDMFFDKAPKNASDTCYDTTANHLIKYYLSYSIAWTITGFAIPLLIILACYGHIIVVLATNGNDNSLLKQRCLKLVVLLLLLFSICFIPYHVFRNLNLKTRILKLEGTCYSSFDDIYISHQVSRGLACLNSTLNPMVYLVGNESFMERASNFSKQARLSVFRWKDTITSRKSTVPCHGDVTPPEIQTNSTANSVRLELIV